MMRGAEENLPARKVRASITSWIFNHTRLGVAALVWWNGLCSFDKAVGVRGKKKTIWCHRHTWCCPLKQRLLKWEHGRGCKKLALQDAQKSDKGEIDSSSSWQWQNGMHPKWR